MDPDLEFMQWHDAHLVCIVREQREIRLEFAALSCYRKVSPGVWDWGTARKVLKTRNRSGSSRLSRCEPVALDVVRHDSRPTCSENGASALRNIRAAERVASFGTTKNGCGSDQWQHQTPPIVSMHDLIRAISRYREVARWRRRATTIDASLVSVGFRNLDSARYGYPLTLDARATQSFLLDPARRPQTSVH
jgi:hypothetical protein